MTSPAKQLEAAIRNPRHGQPVAIMPYLVAGWPDRAAFGDLLEAVCREADAVELGVPFSDPMADGLTIQEASRQALASGVSLRWIFEVLQSRTYEAPIVLMSYLNPLLAYGLERLVKDARACGVHGFIIPDLPMEEAREFRLLCNAEGLGLVQLVTPVTPPERLATLCQASGGFVYAVTVTGITGTKASTDTLLPYLDRIREVSPLPVCAGFGIATSQDVDRLKGHAQGAIVGSALLKHLAQGGEAIGFIRGLRAPR